MEPERHDIRTIRLCLLPGDAVHRQSRSISAATTSGQRVRISQLAIAPSSVRHSHTQKRTVTREVLLPYAAPKKAVHSRVSDSHFPILNSRRCRRGSAIDFLGLEALLRMAVAVHGNQLAHPAPAHGIALAMENEIDGFAGL